jgi:hypothetical protein
MISVEGDTLTSTEELARARLTAPGAAGWLSVRLPLSVPPILVEEPGREKLMAGEVTLKLVLVEESSPGLEATSVYPFPAVLTVRLLKAAMPL